MEDKAAAGTIRIHQGNSAINSSFAYQSRLDPLNVIRGQDEAYLLSNAGVAEILKTVLALLEQ